MQRRSPINSAPASHADDRYPRGQSGAEVTLGLIPLCDREPEARVGTQDLARRLRERD